jgi:hypothetical protein
MLQASSNRNEASLSWSPHLATRIPVPLYPYYDRLALNSLHTYTKLYPNYLGLKDTRTDRHSRINLINEHTCLARRIWTLFRPRRYSWPATWFREPLHWRPRLRGRNSGTRDRCCDFLNIFAKKFSKKLAFLTQNKAKLCKILIITLVLEKNAIFSAKIGKNRWKLWS